MLSGFGIYEDAIKDVLDYCRGALEGAQTVVEKYTADGPALSEFTFEIEDAAIEVMKESFDFTDFTNSVIKAVFKVTTEALNENSFFQKIGAKFTSFTNCHDSHLYMELDGVTTRIVDESDVIDNVKDYIIDALCIEANSYLEECREGTVYPRDNIEADIEDAYISNSDIISFLEKGEVSEEMRQLFFENAEAI